MGAVFPGDDPGLAAAPSRRLSATAAMQSIFGERNYIHPLTVAGWAVGAVVTLVLFSPVVVPAYWQPRVHLVLDTVDACVALLAAYMAHQRFRRGRQRQDLYLAQGLAALALAAVGPPALAMVLQVPPSSFDVWLRLTGQLIAVGLIVTAALVG